MRSSPARAIALVSGTRPLLFLVTVATVALCVALAVAVPVARAQLAPTPDAAPAPTGASEVGASEASGEQTGEAAPATEAAPADAAPAAVTVPADAVPTPASSPTEEAPPPEVAADTEVTAADLGAKESRVLPGNPLYAFKRFGWRMQKAFTFNPVKKAALDLQHANQELADAQKRAAATGANEAVVRSLERAQGRLQAISERVGVLQDAKATNAQGVDALLERAAASALQQQKAMERIAHEAPAEFQERIAEHRDGVLAEVGTFMGNVDAPDAMRQRFERAMEQQRGSAFKDFKNLEVLQRIVAKVPEQARAAIRAAQERSADRMAAQLANSPEQTAVFEEYVKHLPGDTVRQFEILDDLRSKADLPSEFVQKMDKMKARVVEKFNGEFAERSAEGRERMLEAFRGGDVEAVRVAEQFKNFVPPEARVEIEKHENESIEKFKAQFSGQKSATGEDVGAVADQAKQLMEKLQTNPDPLDFKLLDQLKENLTPDQQEFVKGLERDGARRFEEQFRTQGAQFLERFVDPNAPQSLEVLEGLRGSAPGIQGIDRAIEVHRRRFQEHLQDLEYSETLGNVNDALEGDADLKAGFEKGDPSFFLKLGAQQERIELQQREKFDAQIRERLQREAGEGALENVQQLTPEEKQQFLEQGGFPGGFAPPGFPGGFPRPDMMPGGSDFPGRGRPFEGGGFMPPGGPQGMPFGGPDSDHRDENRETFDVRPNDEQRGDRRRELPPLPPQVQKNFEDRQEVRADRGEEHPVDGAQGSRDERRDAPSLPTPPRFDGGPSSGGGGGFGPMMPGGFGPGASGGDHGGFGAPQPPPSFDGEPLGILTPFATVIALLP